MASVPEAMVGPIAMVYGEQPNDASLTFKEALAQTEALKLQLTQKPIIVNRLLGSFGVGDLPMDFMSGGSKVHQFLDVRKEHPCQLDFDAIGSSMATSNYKGLPEPFRMKNEPMVPCYMEIFVIQKEGGTTDIVKHVAFDGMQKLSIGKVKDMCSGVCMKIVYVRNGSKALQYMLEQLGGFQVRYYMLVPSKAPKVNKDADALKDGFAYIKECGPKGNLDNEFVKWAEIEIHREASPIFGWNAGLVDKSLRNRANAQVLARTISFYPLTIKDIAAWFLDTILMSLIPHMLTSSVLWIGKAGRGKSPVANILSMAFSHFYIQRDDKEMSPSLRTASDLDFPGASRAHCTSHVSSTTACSTSRHPRR